MSNYLFFLLIHPSKTLYAVPFYAKAIKKRFSSSGSPPKYYPQYIHTVYKEIKNSYFSSEVRFIKSCFRKSSEKTDNYSIHYSWSIFLLFYLLFYLVTIESKCPIIERGHPERKNFLYI